MELRPPLNHGVVAIEKGAFSSPSTKIANFTFIISYLKPYNCVQYFIEIFMQILCIKNSYLKL